jgi:anti-sigma factor RsiW
MRCVEVVELVTDYVEGRLTLRERVRFELHLWACGACRAYLRQMRHTVQALGRVRRAPLPEALEAELTRRFQGWAARTPAGDEKA